MMPRTPTPSDGGTGTPEVGESATTARTSFEPSIARTDTSESATKDKKYVCILPLSSEFNAGGKAEGSNEGRRK